MRRFIPTVIVAILLAASLAFPAGAARAVSASGLPWSSGVFAAHNATDATNFAIWRGRPIDNIVVFPTRDSWSAMNNPWYLSSSAIPAGFSGDVIAAVPLWPRNSSVSTNADSQWRTFARQLAAVDPDAYVRLGWEMNIGQYWKVTSSNRQQWISAFNRAASAMKSVAPGLRIVWNPNWGADQSGTDSRVVFQSIKNNVSVYAVDIYDAYPADTSDAAANVRLNGNRALADSLAYAVQNGKKFALPEWGVACTTSGCQWQGTAGGDNPRYITDALGFLGAHAADVAFESYFNEPASYIGSVRETVVRHEALLFRMEVGDLHRLAVVAAG